MSYLGNEPPQIAGYSTQTKAAPVGSSIALNQEGTVNSILLFLDGVRQTPTTDYTVSGSTLTLTSTAPTSAVATILFLGDVADIGTPSSDTVNVAELETTSAGTTGQFLKKTGAATIDWDEVASGIAWQAVQTTGFTAVAGKGYPCNTTAAGFTVTLPASASVGDEIALVDYAGTFDSNFLELDPNGLKMKGSTDNLQLDTEREGAVITYIDATQGWVATSARTSTALSPLEYDIDFLVIGGAGGGGFGQSIYQTGGGGGAGGYRTSTETHTGSTGVITITVGDGAAGLNADGQTPVQGSASSVSGTGITTLSSAGGGGGAGYNSVTGGTGASGGGGGSLSGAGGTGNSPSTSPVQGYNGGSAAGSGGGAANSAGGGGGSSAIGTNASAGNAGDGGAGTASSITGAAVTRAGGGGGGAQGSGASAGVAGSGGGGIGGLNQQAGANGTVNTGSGGGGGSNNAGGATSSTGGGNGGKGVVILSMPTGGYSGVTTGSPTVATDSGNTILTFTGTGSYTG